MTRRTTRRVAVVVDVDAVPAEPAEELSKAIAGLVRPELVDWAEVGDHTGQDADGVPDTGDRAAARAVSLGVPTVLACGDDVTVRRCLEALAGASTALGIVSLGQGSLLAANIGLPPGLEAVPHALEGEIRHIDVGEADGELFGVHAGFGIDALAGRRRGGEAFRFADLVEGVRALWRATTAVTIHVDGVQRFDGRTAAVVVANAPRGAGRAVIVREAAPDDGLLDLVVVAPRQPHQRLRSWWNLLLGNPQDERDLLRVRGEWLAVQLWDRRGMELDGEARPRTGRVDVRVWPSALAVRVPPDDLIDPEEVTEVGSIETPVADTPAEVTAEVTAEPPLEGSDEVADPPTERSGTASEAGRRPRRRPRAEAEGTSTN